MRAVSRGGTGRPLGETVEGTGAKLMCLEDNFGGANLPLPLDISAGQCCFYFSFKLVNFGMRVGRIIQVST